MCRIFLPLAVLTKIDALEETRETDAKVYYLGLRNVTVPISIGFHVLNERLQNTGTPGSSTLDTIDRLCAQSYLLMASLED